ncbi:MAG: hydrogenase maturation nickel metallochaperone HypA, partial [Lentisphaeria bacterium]
MHEFSLAEGLIKAVEEELVKIHCPGSGLTKVCVLVGEMRQVVPETLKFAYKTLASETAAANSTLELKFQPVEAVCR